MSVLLKSLSEGGIDGAKKEQKIERQGGLLPKCFPRGVPETVKQEKQENENRRGAGIPYPLLPGK